MNCLLDTHAFLWAAMSPQQLSQDTQAIIMQQRKWALYFLH
jgi:PIN domain nuclease of toxin-antitoxin system